MDQTKGSSGFFGFSLTSCPTSRDRAVPRSYSAATYRKPSLSTTIVASMSSPIHHRKFRTGTSPRRKGSRSQPCTSPPEFANHTVSPEIATEFSIETLLSPRARRSSSSHPGVWKTIFGSTETKPESFNSRFRRTICNQLFSPPVIKWSLRIRGAPSQSSFHIIGLTSSPERFHSSTSSSGRSNAKILSLPSREPL